MAKLSLALIVKNEEKNLPRCLDSVKGLYDELVVVDTGSTDATVAIASRYTDKVFFFEWVNDFAKARNFSFSKCSNEWVMWIDADDILKPNDIKTIREEFEKLSVQDHLDFLLINYHYWVEPPTAEGAAKATQLRERIIRKSKALWRERCHEHIIVDWNKSATIDSAYVWHLRDNEDRILDADRNINIMKLCIQENPNARNHHYLAQEYADHGKHEEAIESYKKSIEMCDTVENSFQTCFKIGKSYAILGKNSDAIEWIKKSLDYSVAYREPLQVIGELYFNQNDFEKAAFWLESLLNIPEPARPVMIVVKELYQQPWMVYNQLLKCYYNTRQYAKAAVVCNKLYEFTKQAGLINDLTSIQNEIKKTYKRPATITRLNLGCGGKAEPGYINCDLFPGPKVDEVFSLDEVPYADKSVDEIASEHALEHIPRPRAEKAILEWARVIKKGGKLKLKVPDLELCCKKFMEDPANRDNWWMHTLYGVQDHRGDPSAGLPGSVNYGQIHYTGFTKERLSKLLTEAGFVIDHMSNYDGWDTPSIAVEAHIPDLQTGQIKKIAFINNSLIPRYLSYGDYWADAFKASGHEVVELRYDKISQLPQGQDLYFFLEGAPRYNPLQISAVAPKALYTQEEQQPENLRAYDFIFTPDAAKCGRWRAMGFNAHEIPNTNHAQHITAILQIANTSAPGAVVAQAPRTSSVSQITDIIIPSYKNLSYLSLTVDSVRLNTTNYRLIVVNSGDDQSVRAYLQQQKDIVLLDTTDRLNFSKALNKALNLSSNDVVLLNNDVIVGPGWLEHLRSAPFDIVNPFSNCDAGWIHNYEDIVGGIKLHPNMTINQVNLNALMGATSSHTEIFPREWVAFYATYIKRKVINAVGLLDENFANGGEDFDYCRRAGKLGFTCGHNFASWVFHFGGKTRKVSEDENYNQHQAEDKYNNNFMNHKAKPTVVIYTGPAYERWTVENINGVGIGGSETCAALLAQEFARLNYRAVVIGDCAGMEGNYAGVEYLHHNRFFEFMDSNYIDYFISSRTVAPFAHKIRSRKNYVWIHDIWLNQNREVAHQDKINKFVCLTPWHVDFVTKHHDIRRSHIYIQPNGLDLGRYSNINSIQKDPNRLIYSSSPDRGLLQLLDIFQKLKVDFPQLTLDIFYGFDNWEKAAAQRNNPQEMAHLNAIKAKVKMAGVTYHGRTPQNKLAVEQMKSSLCVYPTWFDETFCISMVEMMAARCIPVVTNLAGLQTTVPNHAGIKVATPEACYQATMGLLRNPEKQNQLRDAGQQYVKQFSWPETAKRWIQMFNET